MLTKTTAVISLVLFCAAGCSKHDKGQQAAAKAPPAQAAAPAQPAQAAAPAPAKAPDKAKDVAHAAELWTQVGPAYGKWNHASAAPVAGKQPHGAFIHTFYNDTVKGAIGAAGPWPDGSILVKDNYMPNAAKNGPGKKVIVTVMSKENGTWFWAKYKTDGTLDVTPPDAKMPNMPIAGSHGLRCIHCHQNKGTRDMVVGALTAK